MQSTLSSSLSSFLFEKIDYCFLQSFLLSFCVLSNSVFCGRFMCFNVVVPSSAIATNLPNVAANLPVRL